MNIRHLWSRICGKYTGYDFDLVLKVGVNGHSYKEAREDAQEIADIIEVRLKDYLEGIPHQKIKIKE